MLASNTVLALCPCLNGKVSSVIGVYWIVSHTTTAQECLLFVNCQEKLYQISDVLVAHLTALKQEHNMFFSFFLQSGIVISANMNDIKQRSGQIDGRR